MKFCIKDFSVNVTNQQETEDSVTFTEKSFMKNFIFCEVKCKM